VALDLDAELSALDANMRRRCDMWIAEYEELLVGETNRYSRETLIEQLEKTRAARAENELAIEGHHRAMDLHQQRVSEWLRARQDSNLRPTA
jgi:hypothetical protein